MMGSTQVLVTGWIVRIAESGISLPKGEKKDKDRTRNIAIPRSGNFRI